MYLQYLHQDVCLKDSAQFYTEADEEKSKNVLVNGLSTESVLTKKEDETKQHFTQPPAHYTEASLVKRYWRTGIGRPSTYAPTISTIGLKDDMLQKRPKQYMTEIGEVVNNIMKQILPKYCGCEFHSKYGRAFWIW